MFSDPVKNLKAFALRDDMIIADIGAGLGFYSIPAAKMVPRGKVYVIEVQKDYLTTIKNKALENHLDNIEFFLGDAEKIGGTKIKDQVIDAVIVSNIFFQIEDKDNFIEEIKRILKPKGRILIIDWSQVPFSIGSSFGEVVPKEKVRAMFEERGFIFQQDINAGVHHYGIILMKL